jgi:hypothetical protein
MAVFYICAIVTISVFMAIHLGDLVDYFFGDTFVTYYGVIG